MKKVRRALAWLLSLGLLCAGTAGARAPDPVIYGYREGLAQAGAGGLWGFANTAGEIVVPIQYDSVTDFTLGVARVEKDDKLGLIRQDGVELLSPQYDTLSHIDYGLYLAQAGDAWGVVSLLPFEDQEGNLTHELVPVSCTGASLGTVDGLEVLWLDGAEGRSMVPLSSLPGMMEEKGVPSARFPLHKGVLPRFEDVGPRDWFSLWVDLAYNLGLMEGVGNDRFAPGHTLTVAELIKLAAFLESQAIDDDFHLQPFLSTPWYSSCVAYCVATGVITSGEFDDYERPITRAEMVRVLSRTTLGRQLPPINDVERIKETIPDVKAGDYAADAIFGFYAKGVLTGVDGNLTFAPNSPLTRAEAAAVVVRMARAEQRMLLWEESQPDTQQ